MKHTQCDMHFFYNALAIGRKFSEDCRNRDFLSERQHRIALMGSNITVAVECALAKETRPFIDVMDNAEHVRRSGVDITVGEYRGIRLVVGEGGMGTVSAGAAAQLLIDRYEPDYLIFSGIAGGLNPGLQVGDIVLGGQLHYLETNTPIIAECAPWLEYFTSDSELMDIALGVMREHGWRRIPSLREKVATPDSAWSGECGVDIDATAADVTNAGATAAEEKNEHRFVYGTIATSNQFNTDPEILETIRTTVHADCEEMEGAAVAHICAKSGVPFLGIRALSNQCGESYESLDDHEHDLYAAANAAASIALGVIDTIARR